MIICISVGTIRCYFRYKIFAVYISMLASWVLRDLQGNAIIARKKTWENTSISLLTLLYC